MQPLILSFFVLFFIGELSQATLAPRRASIMLQIAGSTSSLNMDSLSENFAHTGRADILYLVRNGPSFGFHYTTESRNDVGRLETGNAAGAVLGLYLQQGTFLVATYDFNATLGQWKEGSGYQGDFGYLEHVGNQFHIGLKYTQRSIVYKKNLQNALSTQRTVTTAYPSLRLTYLF